MAGRENMMTADSTNTALAQSLQAQHHELRDFLKEGTQILADPLWAADDLFSLLAVLRRHMLEHFEHEEKGGYFREAILIRPQLAPQAEALLEQHADFVAMIEELLVMARTDNIPAAVRNDLETRWQQFNIEFCRHEAGEVDLLQDAFTEDLGTGD